MLPCVGSTDDPHVAEVYVLCSTMRIRPSRSIQLAVETHGSPLYTCNDLRDDVSRTSVGLNPMCALGMGGPSSCGGGLRDTSARMWHSEILGLLLLAMSLRMVYVLFTVSKSHRCLEEDMGR